MRVWLLTVGEPLPIDGGSDRLWRTGLLARALTARGHHVMWWTSAFNHFRRTTRAPADMGVRVSDRLEVWPLSGREYRRNVSLDRIRNHREVAARFLQLAPGQPRPDVILSSLPTLELCDAAVQFGSNHGVPVAIDVRDLWPDVLFDLVPAPLRGVTTFAATWMQRELARAARGATAILGVTDEFVDWAAAAGARARTNLDRAFPMGYSVERPEDGEIASARDLWRSRGVDGDERPTVCFFGTLGWMFDFDTVVAAARLVRASGARIQFVICGANGLDAMKHKAAGLDNIVLPGHVGAAEIWTLMRMSIAGLAPYRALSNFEDNLPNKPIEYLSAGLPVVASDLRLLGGLLRAEACGLTYAHGDADALAAVIRILVEDPSRRREMSFRAAQLFAERFTAERVYSAMSAHLEGLAVHV
jgi:glycosyltransferase involved in cell wall biosynthesis